MKTALLTIALLAVLTASTLHSTVYAVSTKAISTPVTKNSSAELNSELARARNATAKYHSVEAAEADGYISINFCEPGEGCHWLNPSYIDGTFDAQRPEILLYAPGENGLRLVAVEYVEPIALLPGGPPEGFTGDEDLWREDTEEAGLWELTVWLWLHNPNGMFEQHNPRVP
jgi:hypothetical protein